MIDRSARNAMSKALGEYMAEEASAFELDDALDRLARSTEDGTVKFVRKLIWFHYDDLRDHKIVATKQEWDYFNRLLFLLESDAEGEFVKTRGTWGVGFRNLLRREKASVSKLAIAPFPSISSMVSLRRKMKEFGRSRYPEELVGRSIRHSFIEMMMLVWSGMWALIFSPIIFIGLLLPLNQYEPRIKMPHQ